MFPGFPSRVCHVSELLSWLALWRGSRLHVPAATVSHSFQVNTHTHKKGLNSGRIRLYTAMSPSWEQPTTAECWQTPEGGSSIWSVRLSRGRGSCLWSTCTANQHFLACPDMINGQRNHPIPDSRIWCSTSKNIWNILLILFKMFWFFSHFVWDIFAHFFTKWLHYLLKKVGMVETKGRKS